MVTATLRTVQVPLYLFCRDRLTSLRDMRGVRDDSVHPRGVRRNGEVM